MNAILDGLEKYMSFSINNELNFNGGYQFLCDLLNSLAKNIGFKYFKMILSI